MTGDGMHDMLGDQVAKFAAERNLTIKAANSKDEILQMN